jgi:hydroxycarboxylate dehydrogenase B
VSADRLHVSAAALRAIAAAIIGAAGSEPAEAELVAEHLVAANLTGHDSHGAGLVPMYVEFVAAGVVVPNTPLRMVEDGGAFLRLAGDRGYGQRVGHEAMRLGIERTRERGVCTLALAGSGHLGRIGAYGEQVTAAGLASIHLVNVVDHDPLVAPFGGSDARFGTNPLCIAIPAGAEWPATVIDMATSAVSFGKLRVALNEGRPAPAGALIDGQGRPTTDPAVMFPPATGALLPVGGYKGHGLMLACELLAGALTGGGTMQPANERRNGIVNHMLAFVLDPARFADPAWMRHEVDAMLDYMAASPAAPGTGPVRQPGEPERRTRERRQAKGIPIDATTWQQLLAAGASVGIGGEQIAGELRRRPVA